LPYRYRGDAPDHLKLMDRREDFRRGHIPPGALLLTVGADVQMRGIYYEVLAWGPSRESWVIEAGYLDGETEFADAGAFALLTEVYERRWPDAYGNTWRHDEFGVDAGYRTNTIYEWTRRHAGTKALKGLEGWARPALGTATDQDVDYRGRRIKGGAKLRGVGTWALKSTFYSYLGLTVDRINGAFFCPPGYCHFGSFLDEIYFKQITAEHLVDEPYRGRKRQVWKQHGNADNHFLDCRVYNLALADAYHASFTASDWAERAKERGIPVDLQKPDLFTPREFQTPASPAAHVEAESSDYLDRLAKLNKGAW
jgi:phage terminase large subunit GpA-like protein